MLWSALRTADEESTDAGREVDLTMQREHDVTTCETLNPGL